MKIPSADEISPSRGLNLDERVALQHFSGIDKQGAAALFSQNPLFYISDLYWMGDVAFDYYLPCFVLYLKSEKSNRDADALHAFIRMLEFKLFDEGKALIPSKQTIVDAVCYCLHNYEKFQINETNYGYLNQDLEMILKKLDANNGLC